jgi:PAS domain S-box-containing protein
MERRLCESEKTYRLLVNNIPGIVFTGYKDWSIDFTDNKIEALSGYTKEDFDSRKLKWIDIVVKDDIEQIKRVFTEALKASKIYIREYRIKSKKGEIIWIQQRGQITCDKQGEVLHIHGVLFDISDLKRAEEEKEKLEARIQQVQRMEAVGTLAEGMAHDFNNLLMGIQGNTSLMLVDTDSSHPHYRRLQNIEKYVQGGSELTSQLLGFARKGKYEVKLTDLNETVKKTSGTFSRTKKEIKIDRKYQQDIWTVEVDRVQIEQVLLNLYVNAWQVMPGGGELYLQTENITLDKDYVKPYEAEPGKYVKISITDTGFGMDEETRQRIFDPFFTTKEMGKGTGLGLASVYGIIKNHGGIINVYSEKGEGTTFNIYLPASEKKLIEEKELPKELLKGTETVLLVDDEDMIIDVGSQMLNKLGYEPLTATSGKEAIELFEANKDKIDMVILDMIMPEIGGGEAYDRMKEINPDIKVLLASGYSINGQATEILARGCNGFIQKPFSMSQFSQKIREILDS